MGYGAVDGPTLFFVITLQFSEYKIAKALPELKLSCPMSCSWGLK